MTASTEASESLRGAYQTFTANLQMAQGFRTLFSCFAEMVRDDLKEPEKTKDFLPLLLFIGYKLSDLAAGFSPEAQEHDLEFFRDIADEGILDLNREPTEKEQKWLENNLAASWRSKSGRKEFWFPSKEESTDVRLALHRGLLSQCLLISASAFEGYIKDITAAAVLSSQAIKRHFYDEASRKGGPRLALRVLEGGPEAYATFVADLIGTPTPDSIDHHFQKLIGTSSSFWAGPDRSDFVEVMEYRHLIAHRAGVVDSAFKRRTGCAEEVGGPVRVSPELANKSIEVTLRIGSKIQRAVVAVVTGSGIGLSE